MWSKIYTFSPSTKPKTPYTFDKQDPLFLPATTPKTPVVLTPAREGFAGGIPKRYAYSRRPAAEDTAIAREIQRTSQRIFAKLFLTSWRIMSTKPVRNGEWL